ncbi:hypothetical protein LTR56_019577 [Elasticomyces elasticus]|nr:hypothetical protein LTR56_019577 [Elasticomyces elasticus]KAK3662579.1 hypothetical protein LTR22_006645 [Elasticomyces elasticus]KAK4927923.1 hypothetical protein LTR49_005345 [Elasticomyces elasticus]
MAVPGTHGASIDSTEHPPAPNAIDLAYFAWPPGLPHLKNVSSTSSGVERAKPTTQQAANISSAGLPQHNKRRVQRASARPTRPAGRGAQADAATAQSLRMVPSTQHKRRGLQVQGQGHEPETAAALGLQRSYIAPTGHDLPTLLVHQPMSEEIRLRSEFIVCHSLFDRKDEESRKWYYYECSPSRIGYTQLQDLACRAWVTAVHYRRGYPGVTLRKCYVALTNAIDALQTDLALEHPNGISDSVLMSIVGLAAVEAVKGKSNTWQS